MAEFDDHLTRIDTLLGARERVYPERDSSYLLLQEGIDGLTDFLLERFEQDREWQPARDVVHEAQRLQKNPIFICGSMKSGTTLLTRLLDNHPRLIVMPGDGHFGDVFLRKEFSFEELARHWMRRLVNPTGQRPFWFLGRQEGGYLDFLRYLKFFLDNPGIETVPAAIVCSIFHDRLGHGSVRYWVEKTPHTELLADVLRQAFPDARFLHVVRDPRSNAASLKRLAALRRRGWTAKGTADTLARVMSTGWQNSRYFANYYLLHFEQLLEEPERTMRDVAAFLCLDFDENMLVPTENGALTRSNSMYLETRKTEEGTVSRDAGRRRTWRSELNWQEKRDIYLHTSRVAKLFGYSYGIAGRLCDCYQKLFKR